MAGMHFFNPVPVLPLVEIVRGEVTGDVAFDTAYAFAERIGKQPIACGDTPGFVVNRILVPVLADAVRVLEEGTASAEDIDKGMKLGTNWPIGPLALIDLIGDRRAWCTSARRSGRRTASRGSRRRRGSCAWRRPASSAARAARASTATTADRSAAPGMRSRAPRHGSLDGRARAAVARSAPRRGGDRTDRDLVPRAGDPDADRLRQARPRPLGGGEAGLIVAVVGVGRLSGFYVAGRAVDLHGERRVLFGGAVAAGVLGAIAAGLPFAAMLAVLFVAGSSSRRPRPRAASSSTPRSPSTRRDIAMGIRQAAVPLGGMAAAGVLPLVAEAAGWRTAFAVAGAFAVHGAAVALATAGLGPRLRRSERRPRPSTRGILTWDVRLWTFWATIMVGSQYVVLTFFAIDVEDRAEVSQKTAALLLLVFQAGGIVGRLAWGWAADRMPRARARRLPVGMTALSRRDRGAARGGTGHGLAGFAALGLLLGVSVNSWQGIWMTRLTEMAGVENAGTATGVCLSFMALGWIVMTPSLGAVADATGGHAAMWGALAGLIALAGAAVLAIRETASEG